MRDQTWGRDPGVGFSVRRSGGVSCQMMCQAALLLHPALLLSLLAPSFRRNPTSPAQPPLTPFARHFVVGKAAPVPPRSFAVFWTRKWPDRHSLLPQPSLLHLTTYEIDHWSGLHTVFFFCCQDRANSTLVEAPRHNCRTSVDFDLSTSHSFWLQINLFAPPKSFFCG
jgi:hypothetical protein